MIPAHRKEDKVSTTKENMRLNKENERLQSYVDKVNAEKIRKGWFGSKRVEPVPSTPFKPIAYATGGSALAGLVQTAQTMDALAPKKKLFKKREVIPNNSASDIAVEKALNSNPHIEALKKEFNDPKAKWREELAKAKMRVDILEEMNQANEGLK